MCGITFAASTWLSDAEVEMFHGLLYHSMDRGVDSTGVFALQEEAKNRKRTILYHKDTLDPASFLDTEQAKQVLFPKERRNVLVVGHNRWATVGDVTRKNSHPFSLPNIIGVHNGTIPSVSLKHAKDHDTDSEAFLRAISEDGVDDTLMRVDKSGGAFTLVYYDKTKHVLNLVRNFQRPFAIAADAGIVYGASEKEMLEWYLKRTSHRTYRYTELTPWTLYSFDMNNFSERPKERILKRHIAVYTGYTPGNYGGNYRSSGSYSGVNHSSTVDLSMTKVWNPATHSWTYRFPFATICKNGKAPWEDGFDAPVTPPEDDLKQRQEEEKKRVAAAEVPDLPESLRRGAKDATRPATSVPQTGKGVASSGVPGDDEADETGTTDRADTGEDELFLNRDGRVLTRGELETVLNQPCGYCSNFFSVADAVTPIGQIRGLVYKTDTGDTFVCEECIASEERKVNKRSVH